MRRSLFFLVAVMVLPTPALSAQSLWLGAKAGRSSAKLADEDLGRRVAFTGGVTLTIEFTQALALQGEVLYAEKGFVDRPGDWEMQITYLEIPVLLRLAIPTKTLIRPVVLAGFAWSLEVDCGGWTTLPYIGPPPPPIPLDCDHMRTDHLDMGWVVGGGLEFRVGRFSVTVEGRYTGGMIDIGSHYTFANVKNETVAFLVGVGLPIWRL